MLVPDLPGRGRCLGCCGNLGKRGVELHWWKVAGRWSLWWQCGTGGIAMLELEACVGINRSGCGLNSAGLETRQAVFCLVGRSLAGSFCQGELQGRKLDCMCRYKVGQGGGATWSVGTWCCISS